MGRKKVFQVIECVRVCASVCVRACKCVRVCVCLYVRASTQTNCPRPIAHPKKKKEEEEERCLQPEPLTLCKLNATQFMQAKTEACPFSKVFPSPPPPFFFFPPGLRGSLSSLLRWQVSPPAATRTLLVVSCPGACFLFFLLN